MSTLGEQLERRLQQTDQALPRSGMAPALTYGRHRGPAPTDSRVAAVALTLYESEPGQWVIPLTKRPTSLKHHAGQVCLPGGRVEPGESIHQAAVREYEEELGVRPKVLADCGELDMQYVYNSDNRVHPVVLVTERPDRPWRPDPTEVVEVILLPLSVLLHQKLPNPMTKSRRVVRDGKTVGSFQFRAGAIDYGGHRIWGATALILDQFGRIARQLVAEI